MSRTSLVKLITDVLSNFYDMNVLTAEAVG